MGTPSTKRGRPWPVLLMVVGLAVGALLAVGAARVFPGLSLFSTESESRDSQIINSITREEQVVLLSLGIQGIREQKESGKIFGMSVPGSERAPRSYSMPSPPSWA